MDESRPKALRQLHESVNYSLCMGHGYEWPAVRERVNALALDAGALQDLKQLDGDALDYALSAEADELFVPEANEQPVEHWWWHLRALRDGTYPIDQLPAHLEAIYREQHPLSA